MPTQLERLHALAAMAQAACLSLQISTEGSCSPLLAKTQLQSLFVLDPTHFHTIYGHPNELKLGFFFVERLAQHPWQTMRTKPAYRLMQSFLFLGRKILLDAKLQKEVRTQLQRIEQQAQYFGSIEHPRILHNLADLYLDIATRSRLRLQIVGKKEFLQNPELIAKIRALLFSGVRAAVLWYQMHGNVLRFFWDRPFILQEVKRILSN